MLMREYIKICIRELLVLILLLTINVNKGPQNF